MLYMTHKEHGATNVPDGEQAAMEKNGWKVSTPQEWFKLMKPAKEEKAKKL